MDISQITILAIVQGITEFLPISSSAHLVLVPKLTGWQDQGLVFDIALHVGSLLAVVTYFYRDIAKISLAGFESAFSFKFNPESRLFFAVGFATIPVGFAGLIFNDFISEHMRSAHVIAWASIFFGTLLLVSDIKGKKIKNEYMLTNTDVFWIGMAQALALIPGTSRSGITMAAGLFIGLKRKAAARFSFLLAIPVIFLAGGLKVLELTSSDLAVDVELLVSAMLISAVAAFLCIHFFLKLLNQVGLLPFVAYRVLLGLVLLWVF